MNKDSHYWEFRGQGVPGTATTRTFTTRSLLIKGENPGARCVRFGCKFACLTRDCRSLGVYEGGMKAVKGLEEQRLRKVPQRLLN